MEAIYYFFLKKKGTKSEIKIIKLKIWQKLSIYLFI